MLRTLYLEIIISPMMYCTTAVVGLISPNSVYLLNFLRALLLAKLLGAFIESMTALVHSKNELQIVHTAPVEAKKGFCSFATESFRKNELLFLYGLASSSVYVISLPYTHTHIVRLLRPHQLGRSFSKCYQRMASTRGGVQ